MGRGSETGIVHADELPLHKVVLSPFYIDRTPVTYEKFRQFVQETDYTTDAEKQGFAMYFEEGYRDFTWKPRKGRSFRNPFEDSFDMKEMPVVNISWQDAVNFCNHYEKRLPTEAEWEFAARAGREKTRFPWGDELYPEGKIMGNHWQGAVDEKGKDHFKNLNTDGFMFLSPVRAFPPNRYGIYDMVGNVWEFTSDWYSPEYYAYSRSHFPDGIKNPDGPEHGQKKVTRGGSWWCSEKTCTGFGLYLRGKIKPDLSFPNLGFRCAKDAR